MYVDLAANMVYNNFGTVGVAPKNITSLKLNKIKAWCSENIRIFFSQMTIEITVEGKWTDKDLDKNYTAIKWHSNSPIISPSQNHSSVVTHLEKPLQAWFRRRNTCRWGAECVRDHLNLATTSSTYRCIWDEPHYLHLETSMYITDSIYFWGSSNLRNHSSGWPIDREWYIKWPSRIGSAYNLHYRYTLKTWVSVIFNVYVWVMRSCP